VRLLHVQFTCKRKLCIFHAFKNYSPGTKKFVLRNLIMERYIPGKKKIVPRDVNSLVTRKRNVTLWVEKKIAPRNATLLVEHPFQLTLSYFLKTTDVGNDLRLVWKSSSDQLKLPHVYISGGGGLYLSRASLMMTAIPSLNVILLYYGSARTSTQGYSIFANCISINH